MTAVLAVVAAAGAGFGVYLVYTAIVGRPQPAGSWRTRLAARPVRAGIGAGLEGVRVRPLVATMALLAVAVGAGAFAIFGGVVPAVLAAVFATSFPIASWKARQHQRVAVAREAWPRMLEELRMLTGSAGRSIPQALFEVGRRAPDELRPAFARAEREWLLTTDFERTVALLKDQLADPTADVVGETLVVAHAVGGSGLDARLAELVEDRIIDQQGRKEAESKQSGVRFARRFVLLVPLGMALAGISIGAGRSAYETPSGQVAVVVGLLAVAVCWVWSGRLLRLPGEPRVFAEPSVSPSPKEGR